MALTTYTHPGALSGPAYFGGNRPLDRLRSLLILTGHGVISHNGVLLKLQNDFMSIPTQPSGNFKVGKIVSKIPGCTSSQIKSLIANGASKNVRIHSNIYLELMHCMAHLETRSYIASFLHLYRLIEHAALYLPLVSIISKGVNDITFAQYKEVIENKAKADLSVLKKFSTNVLNQNIGASTAIYSFANTANPVANCNIAASLLEPNQIQNSGSDFIEVKYKHTDRLIVNFRNQFFHYLYHEKNISLNQLSNPDEFLSICMPNFITYFAFLYRELLIAEWELWA